MSDKSLQSGSISPEGSDLPAKSICVGIGALIGADSGLHTGAYSGTIIGAHPGADSGTDSDMSVACEWPSVVGAPAW